MNKSISRAEDECEHLLNKNWPEAKLSSKTINRVVGQLKHGTNGLKLRLSEINRLHVTETGDLTVLCTESEFDRISTPDSNPDLADSPESPEVMVLGCSEAEYTQGAPLPPATSSRVNTTQAPKSDDTFTRRVRLTPLRFSPISGE